MAVSVVSLSKFLLNYFKGKTLSSSDAYFDRSVFAGQYGVQSMRRHWFPQWATMLLTSYLQLWVGGLLGDEAAALDMAYESLWQNSNLKTTIKKISLLKAVAMDRTRWVYVRLMEVLQPQQPNHMGHAHLSYI